MKNSTTNVSNDSVYVSPKELAHRWQVSRNTVMSIACEEGFVVLCLGKKKGSTIRYLRKEVCLFEKNRMKNLHK